MALCTVCGSKLGDNATVCQSCGSKVKNEQIKIPAEHEVDIFTRIYGQQQRANIEEPEQVREVIKPQPQPESEEVPSKTETKVKPIPIPIVMAHGEVVVKTYRCTTSRKPRGDSFLTVTNKRIIYHGSGSAWGGKSRLVSEVPINQVAGVVNYCGKGLNIILLILSIACEIVGLGLLSQKGGNMVFYGFVIITLGFFVFLKARQTRFKLAIYSSGTMSPPINVLIGKHSGFLRGGTALTLNTEPAREVKGMMNELGALIQDLMTMGEPVMEKWSEDDGIGGMLLGSKK